MPPPMMTNVMPTDTTPITDELTRMLRMLSLVRKLSLLRLPMMISRIRTRTRPTLRSRTESTSLRRTDASGPLSPATSPACSTRACSSVVTSAASSCEEATGSLF
jgi:hypothetical protein